MNADPLLAIIIPAYKIEFFKETIDSIAAQTCKDFTVYIGDDASPDNFQEIIDLYKDKINVVYRRFDHNLGGKDLVAQWNRCIDLIQNEKWIWFFSDDDVMESQCVQLFYDHIGKHADDHIVHFNINIINEQGIKIYKTTKFEPHLSTMDFFSKRLKNEINSCGVEYIFRKDIFERVNRFQPFDLAWSSDDATWVKLSLWTGINTIDYAFVKWRRSSLNISPRSDKKTVLQKWNANVNYLNWANNFFEQNNLLDTTTGLEKIGWLLINIVGTSSLSYKEKYKLIIYSLKSLDLYNLKFKVMILWISRELKKSTKIIIDYDVFLKYKFNV